MLTFRVVAKVNYNSLTGTLRRLVLDALVGRQGAIGGTYVIFMCSATD